MTGRQSADRRPGVLDDRRVRIGLVVLVVVAIVVGLVAAVVTRSSPATQPTPTVWSAACEGIGDCSISRLDPASLVVATTIDIPCFGFTLTQLGVLDDAIWFADPTAAAPPAAARGCAGSTRIRTNPTTASSSP
jgi:hypothetical protein